MSVRVDPSESDFLNMRRQRLLYVDKTAQVKTFLANGKAQMFIRPRRFGKSLFLSTVKAMYSGDPSVLAAHAPQESDLAVYRDPSWNWHARSVWQWSKDLCETGFFVCLLLTVMVGVLIPGQSQKVLLSLRGCQLVPSHHQ